MHLRPAAADHLSMSTTKPRLSLSGATARTWALTRHLRLVTVPLTFALLPVVWATVLGYYVVVWAVGLGPALFGWRVARRVVLDTAAAYEARPTR
jgi:hypothetical protein